ncbi:MAG: TonB family protein [Pseudomonadota bacterium]
MTIFRWLAGLPLAGLITLGLFAMMAGLIKIEREPGEPKAPPILEIFPKIKETQIDRRSPPPKGPTLDDPPPVDIPPTDRSEAPGPVVSIDPGPPEIVGPEIKGAANVGPLIRYAPPYPDNCRSRGVTGIVLVQFDVTPEGAVVNARVVNAPDRCFNRIVSTVSKWKYPPAYENGRPVMRYGVVEKFNFQLTE